MSNPSSVVSTPSPPAAQVETPLLGSLLVATPNLPISEYHGARTIATFSSPAQELASLLSGVGVYDLGWRIQIVCTGKDRVRWLNGMVTNHVGALAPNAGCYAFALNAQGRIQGDLNIFQHGDEFWLDTDTAQAAPLTALLGRFIIMDDVVLKPSQTTTRLGIAGPNAATVLGQLGLPIDGLESLQMRASIWNGNTVTLVAAHSPLVPRFELWIAQDQVQPLWQALRDAGAAACGAIAVEQLRILEGTPTYGTDITARDLPQETNQTRALHFSKGCYLGQEIVERIRSRGNVHRTFSGFTLGSGFVPADTPLTEKIPILSENQPVGDITSASNILLPDGKEQTFALGYIRREVLDKNAMLYCNDAVAVPAVVPFRWHEKESH
ncbi:MAG TPA: hypothetical protein VMU62_07495 [Acidobacteriaceae bacterium]|nr:hypothetical protein [Acidobacteriaceae bacterium]